EALDAEGRHDEAINELAGAAQRGDVEATTRLAKRIIVGDRAPRLRRDGIALLRDAAKMGGAEAAARLAVIPAAGVLAPPDWHGALRLAMLAAERGWAEARAELDVLLSMTERRPTGAPGPQSVRSAESLLEEAQLRELLLPAPGVIVHENPRICRFPDFV